MVLLLTIVVFKRFIITQKDPEKGIFNAFVYLSYLQPPSASPEYHHQFLSSFQQSKKIGETLQGFGDLPHWKSLGPHDIGGRSLSLFIHPLDTQEIWMGSAGSGLWFSKTGGVGSEAWINVPTGFPVQSVASIAGHPFNPRVLYIGTGENYTTEIPGSGIHTRTLRGSRGIGMLKSEDKGRTWMPMLDYLEHPGLCIWKIIVHPWHPDTLYVSGNMGILKSTDGGNSWDAVMDTCLAMDLLMDPEDPETLYTGVGGYGSPLTALFKTQNGGRTWRKIESPTGDKLQGRIMLALSPANPNKIVAAFSDDFQTKGILWTIDKFENYKYFVPTKDVCAHQGWYSKSLHLKSDDPQKLLMGGVDLYYDSTGTGNKLFNLVYRKIKIHADFHDVISNPKDPNKIYMATDGGVFRSNDFANSFASCNGGYLSTQFYTGSLSPNQNVMMGGLQDNKTAYFSDNNWSLIHFGDGTYNAFHPLEDSTLIVSSQFQNLYISQDLGQSWTQQIPPNEKAAFVSPFCIHPLDPNLMYSGGDKLWHSDQSGRTWRQIPIHHESSFITCLATSRFKKDYVIAGIYNPTTRTGTILPMTNFGNQKLSSGSNFEHQFIRQLVEHPLIEGSYYAAISSNQQTGFAVSKDYGITWEYPNNQSLPPVPCHCIWIDPSKSGTIYLGCDLGLYISFDGGSNWEAYNLHPFDVVAVYDLKYNPSTDRIIAFTHGHGCFEIKRVEQNITTDHFRVKEDCPYHLVHQNRIIGHLCIENPKHLRIFNLNGQEIKTRIENYSIHILHNNPGLILVQEMLSKPVHKFVLL